MSSLDRFHHRQVALTINLKPTVEILNAHFLRLIEEIKPLFLNGGKLAKKIQKQWYGKQLADPTNGFTYGYIWFTVTNRSLMDHKHDPSSNMFEADNLEFSFHVKQNETIALANNFTSGSTRYKTMWGDFNSDRVLFNLYGGTDVESALLFKDLIEKIKPQLTDFSISDNTLIAQSELQLVGITMSNS
jgi:hypothetical protein